MGRGCRQLVRRHDTQPSLGIDQSTGEIAYLGRVAYEGVHASMVARPRARVRDRCSDDLDVPVGQAPGRSPQASRWKTPSWAAKAFHEGMVARAL